MACTAIQRVVPPASRLTPTQDHLLVGSPRSGKSMRGVLPLPTTSLLARLLAGPPPGLSRDPQEQAGQLCPRAEGGLCAFKQKKDLHSHEATQHVEAGQLLPAFPCPNNCGAGPFPSQSNLSRHLNKACPLRVSGPKAGKTLLQMFDSTK